MIEAVYEKKLPDGSILKLLGTSDYSKTIQYASLQHLTDTLDVLVKHVKSPLILDIGANIGFTTVVIDHAFEDADIWAVEPHPVTFAQLKTNIQFNQSGKNRIELHKIALGEEEGELPFRDLDQYNTGNSLLIPGSLAATQQSTVVSVIKLNDLGIPKDKPIDLLKIDVEGFEISVLKGGDDVLPNVKTMLIEFNHWCLTSIAHLFPEDALKYIFEKFDHVMVFDLVLKKYVKIETDAEKWDFLHKNMVRFNVNDLLCTNDEELAKAFLAPKA